MDIVYYYYDYYIVYYYYFVPWCIKALGLWSQDKRLPTSATNVCQPQQQMCANLSKYTARSAPIELLDVVASWLYSSTSTL